MKIFRSSIGPYDLAVAMSGVKMGDQLLQLGCGNGKLFATLASKVGLTGHALGIDDKLAACERAKAAAEKAGVFVEVAHDSYATLNSNDSLFDLTVIHHIIGNMEPEQRVACLQETYRVLKPGGRCLIIEPALRSGLGALFRPPAIDPTYLTSGAEQGLKAEGFRAVRRLAERDGTAFIEGVRPPD